MQLIHWPLTGGLLHLVQRGGDWAGPQPTQAPPRWTKCNSSPINGYGTNHRIAVHVPIKGLRMSSAAIDNAECHRTHLHIGI